ncbi:hypothetical protein OAT06_04125 [Nitrospinaceae bacterium]|nr:hypothetical protein [Nitrospinaceae bacterium]
MNESELNSFLKHSPRIRKYLWRLAIFLFMVGVVTIFLLETPGIRRPLINSIIKIPEYTTFVMVRRAIKHNRDFEQVNRWLNREMDLADWYSPGHGKLLPGLLNNSRYAIDRIRFREEFEAVLPFLEKLVQSQPDLFLARLWLARALSNSNPEEAYKQLDKALKLSSANPEPYRTAIDMALRSKDFLKLNDWCGRYLKSQFGGARFPEHTSPFSGVGLRKLLLEIVDANQNRKMISNMGMQLGSSRKYDFALPEEFQLKSLRLHLAILAGIKIKMEKLELFDKGKLIDVLQDELTLTSMKGFHLEDGSILSTSGDGETISIYSSSGFEDQVDKIVITLRFDRLGLTSPSLCIKDKPSKP